MTFSPLGASSHLEVGDFVEHSLFGRGVIRSLDGGGIHLTATVELFDGSTRIFHMGYAPLRKINSKFQIKDTTPTLRRLIATIQEKYAIGHSDFGDFQISSDISKPDVIAYTERYGFKHLRELRSALIYVFIGAAIEPPASSVDVLDIGCGPGMSRTILWEFGINAKKYSGVDYAENFLWLAKELNSDLTACSLPSIDGQFVKSLDEIEPSGEFGFVIMNHVLNQRFVNESVLTSWAKNLKRIYPNGFSILSVEPEHHVFRYQKNRWMSMLQYENIMCRESLSFGGEGEFRAKKAVSFWICG